MRSTAVALLTAAATAAVTPAASAQQLPVDDPTGLLPPLPPLPGTGDVPGTGGLPGTGDVPGTGGLPGTGDLPGIGDLPGTGGLLPGTPTASGDGSGGGTTGGGSGAPAGGIDASGLDPVISGPRRAATVRVDSKRRFRVSGVAVACPAQSPAPCAVRVRVASTHGAAVKFVSRAFSVRPGAALKLKKLKVSKKGMRALRRKRVARVTTTITATGPGRAPVVGAVALKLKPAKR